MDSRGMQNSKLNRRISALSEKKTFNRNKKTDILKWYKKEIIAEYFVNCKHCHLALNIKTVESGDDDTDNE